MNLVSVLEDVRLKKDEKRKEIINSLNNKEFTIKEINIFKNILDERDLIIVLEAMEVVTRKNPHIADLKWLEFVEEYIIADSNNLKRESSRIVGNIAHLFPNNLKNVIEKLLVNSLDKGTVIRWSSAYALSRIIIIPVYAQSELYNTLLKIYEKEAESGVRGQYQNGLLKAEKIR